MTEEDKKIEQIIESLINKGYLKRYPNNEIGLTEKGLKAGLEIKKKYKKKKS